MLMCHYLLQCLLLCATLLPILITRTAAFFPGNRYEDDFGGMLFGDRLDDDYAFEPAFHASSTLQSGMKKKRNYYMHVWRDVMQRMPMHKGPNGGGLAKRRELLPDSENIPSPF